MKPFLFRLESVLAVWTRREQQALTFLQREQAAMAAARDRVAALEAQRREARLALTSPSTPPRQPDDPAWHQNWITRMTMAVNAAREDALRCAGREEHARVAWQKARRDLRVMERLRDRARRRHESEQRRVERTQMDERAVMSAFRKEGATW